MANRQEAFDALNSEREYQAKRWGDKHHEIDAWVFYICDYADRLKRLGLHVGQPTDELDLVRKVEGLAVVCMERRGARLRKVLP
jgi:hypothetical protein